MEGRPPTGRSELRSLLAGREQAPSGSHVPCQPSKQNSSEIEPYEEGSQEAAAFSGPSSYSRPMSIPRVPSDLGRGAPRTYRVIPSPSPQGGRATLCGGEDMKVVMEGEHEGDDQTVRRGQGYLSTSYGSGGQNNVLQQSGSFFGSFFGRPPTLAVDDGYGEQLLPHHYRSSSLTSSFLNREPQGWAPRSGGVSPNVGSVLGRASGTLRGPTGLRASMSLGNIHDASGAACRQGNGGGDQSPLLRTSSAKFRRASNASGGGGGGSTQASPSSSIPILASSHFKQMQRQQYHDQPLDLNEISVMASGLSGSFGAPGFMRRTASNSSFHSYGLGGGTGLSPCNSSMQLAPPPPCTYPICLICLEMLKPNDFAEGKAISLQCSCRGEVALRHLACAIEWSNVKGNTICDICKCPIQNLPPPDPEVLAAREAAKRRRQPNFSVSGEPTVADYIFDAIRVTWVVMVLCILLLDKPVGLSFFLGLGMGLGYSVLVGCAHLVVSCISRRRVRASASAAPSSAQEPLLPT